MFAHWHSLVPNTNLACQNDFRLSRHERQMHIKSVPLYLYPDEQDLDQTRRVNFDPEALQAPAKTGQAPHHGTPDEVQVFDYIYGVLHCPAYRETYAEFLKIDFPRIPWPATPEEFWDFRQGQRVAQTAPDGPRHHRPHPLSLHRTGRQRGGQAPSSKTARSGSTRPSISRTRPRSHGASTSAATNPRKNGSRTARAANCPLTM